MPLREPIAGCDHFNRAVVQFKIGVITSIRERFIRKPSSAISKLTMRSSMAHTFTSGSRTPTDTSYFPGRNRDGGIVQQEQYSPGGRKVSLSQLVNTTEPSASLTRIRTQAFFASRVTLYIISTAMGSSKFRPDLSLPAEVTRIASNTIGLSETSGPILSLDE